MRNFLISILFLLVAGIFFYPILKGFIPFPGDLLVGEYNPYSSKSYDGYNPGAVTNKAQGPDVIRQLYPWKNLAIDEWKKGHIPFWNPYNFSGNPLMANFQSGVFYPINIVFVPDFVNGWVIYIVLIPVLSLFFMYLFLRELSLGVIASVFGSIVFAFCSYMVVWVEYGNVGHTFLWMPLSLLFIERLIKKVQYKNILILLAIWSFSFLAGYIQGYFYMFLVDVFYYTIRTVQENSFSSKNTFQFVILRGVPFLLCAFQLFPTLELFINSSRGNYSLLQIERLLNPWWYSITVLIPNFFGNPASRNHWFYGTYIERVSYFGLIPFLLSLYGITFWKTSKVIVIFFIIFIVSFLLSINVLFIKFFYFLPIPTISTTVPTRILSLFQFSGSILSAFGLEFFLRYNKKKNLLTIFSITVTLFIIVLMGLFISLHFFSNANANVQITLRNTILPSMLLFLFGTVILVKEKIAKSLTNILVVVLFFATFIDLFYFFHKITPFSPREYIYPKTEVLSFVKENAGINRVWGYADAYLENNFATFEKVFTTDGYDPLFSKRYSELISTTKDGKISKNISRSDANILPGYGEHNLADNQYRQKILNLLGVKYLLYRTGNMEADYNTFPQDIYTLIWQKDNWQIYKNKKAVPRFFLTNEFIIEKNKEKIDRDLFTLPAKTIILENAVNQARANNTPSEVSLISYEPNNIIFKLNSRQDSLLFLSDNYYPGWHVSVDAKENKIYRANYAFRAIPVNKGEHIIKFWYYPKSFDIGLKISIFILIIIGISSLIYKYKFVRI